MLFLKKSPPLCDHCLKIKKHVKLRPSGIKGKPKYHSNADGIRHYRNLTYLNEDTMYEIQKSYLEMISYTDYTFGILLKGLKESGFEDNTAVFASSDHGDFWWRLWTNRKVAWWSR